MAPRLFCGPQTVSSVMRSEHTRLDPVDTPVERVAG